jgi:GT2 family glycosyltransferase
MTEADLIDVIIPVYKGLRQTSRCIESVLGNPQSARFEIVVVDDASPDPEIGTYLKRLADSGRITLLSNERNLGFVRGVNRGMSLHPDRDVVLLNSDTEVANDWLDRLRRCAYGQPDVGTVTPFSNNATICSYPFEGWPGGIPGTLGLAALDRLFATANAGRTVDLPTAVGFCMYIRHACLEQVGLFDADLFGRGYGEENDFCMRAASKGWRSVLAGDVLVFHEGAVSFSDERDALMQAAEKKLLEAHPDYLQQVHEFIARDPLGALRDAADRARFEHGTDEARHVLAERSDECARLRARLTEFAALTRGLAHAEALVAERDAAIRERNEEIAKLRAGLSHAESLAFARAEELERIRKP